MRFTPALSTIFVLLAQGSVFGQPPVLENCIDAATGAQRARCIEEFAAASPITRAELSFLSATVDRDPAAAESVAGGLAAVMERSGDRSPSLIASLLDIQGQALFRQARHGESADVFLRAVEADPGTGKIWWFGPAGDGKSPAWSAEVDPGNGRVVRAGRSLLFAGRMDEAREMLSRAVVLGADEETRVFWGLVSEGSEAGGATTGKPLQAEEWIERIPELAIRTLDGTVARIESPPGKVVLLDFWAAWCAPCRVELPRLQLLVRKEEANGLYAIAVNTDDTDEAAREAAASLGLSLPVGRYDDALDAQFVVRQLPTVILVDRDGRIRRRWDGYREGIEREIADASRALLTEPRDGSETAAIGTSFQGEWEVRWSRELGKPVGGVTLVSGQTNPPTVIALAGRSLSTLRADGKILSTFDAPPGSGRLVSGDFTGDGKPDIVGFRPGGDRVALVDLATGAATTWKAPAPVLHAAAALPGGDRAGRVILSTTDGLFLTDALGRPQQGMPGVALAATPSTVNDQEALLVLGEDGRLRWVGTDGTLLRETVADPNGRGLVTSLPDGRFGVVSSEVIGAVSGRFVSGGGQQIAVATRSGRLVVLDAAAGGLLAVARIEGIVQIGSADLEADGLDEIVVGAGERITALGFSI